MDVQQEIQKAEVLIEAIPYMRRFAGTVVVINNPDAEHRGMLFS